MKQSRFSYSGPPESECGEVLLDLRRCEFCERTFLPDPLLKHKKICYRDFIKRKTISSREKSRSKGDRSSPKDLLGRSMTDIMMVRRIRRMNWRDRHEHFIQVIRSARDNSLISNHALIISTLPNGLDNKEDLRQCKHCLRNFHKDSILKHVILCKEHSIQSNRFIPNDAHTEAKRRMSLRLYYKPKSFKPDFVDDFTTATYSPVTDCSSMASLNSLKINTDISEASSMRSSLSSRNRTFSASSLKSNTSIKIGKQQIYTNIKDHQSRENTKPSIKCIEKSLQNSFKSEKKTSTHNKATKDIPQSARSRSIGGKTISEKRNVRHSQKDKKFQHKSIAQKLEVISNILLKDSSKDLGSKSYDNKSEINVPDPANSLSKAKEVLHYLHIKMKENEVARKICESLKDTLNHEERKEVEEKLNHVTNKQIDDVYDKNNSQSSHARDNAANVNLRNEENRENNVKFERIKTATEDEKVTVRSCDTASRSTDDYDKRQHNIAELFSKMQSFCEKVTCHPDEEYARIWQKQS